MQIYSSEDLNNKYVQQQASDAFVHKKINEEAYKNILTAHPSKLYTPNYFIRIALAVLTLVAIIFSGLLLALIFLTSSQSGGSGLLFFSAILTYVALELIIRARPYYNAGVDNLLIFFTAAFIVSGIAVLSNGGQIEIVSAAAMVVCLLLSARFVDAFMSVLSYLALFVFVFLLYTKAGNFAKATAPFFLMAVSVIVYVLVRRLSKNEKLFFYKDCCKNVMLFTLLTMYASGNYFVIKELSNQMFDLRLELHSTIPFGWLFWIFTFAIPCAYVAYGLKKKEPLFIRTGLVLLAVSIFTFRYYYAIVPAEAAMLIGGALMIAITYALIKYLKKPAFGFSYDKNITPDKERIDLKALIITQVAGKKTTHDSGVEFGGGSFGSGGAGGSY